MNKILEVNEKFGYVVVEPGVTFGDLYTFCAERKLKLWPSVASLGWGSVVGNVRSPCLLWELKTYTRHTPPNLS